MDADNPLQGVKIARRITSHRVLIEAAKGWFLADLRDQKTGDKVQFYDEHGLNRQRAYEIVCLMVGSDQQKFKDLANETMLPDSRQDTCASDHSNAVYSWDLLLKPHLSPPDRPKTEIDSIYGLAQGRALIAQQALRSVHLLQTMQSCGSPNARWDLKTHKLILCYELAEEFADLYRDYGGPKDLRTAATSNGKAGSRPDTQDVETCRWAQA